MQCSVQGDFKNLDESTKKNYGQDNILVVHEILHSLQSKTLEGFGNTTFKLDMVRHMRGLNGLSCWKL